MIKINPTGCDTAQRPLKKLMGIDVPHYKVFTHRYTTEKVKQYIKISDKSLDLDRNCPMRIEKGNHPAFAESGKIAQQSCGVPTTDVHK